MYLFRLCSGCIVYKDYRVIERDGVKCRSPDTVGSLDPGHDKFRYAQSAEHDIEFGTDERAHPGFFDYVLPRDRYQLLYPDS